MSLLMRRVRFRIVIPQSSATAAAPWSWRGSGMVKVSCCLYQPLRKLTPMSARRSCRYALARIPSPPSSILIIVLRPQKQNHEVFQAFSCYRRELSRGLAPCAGSARALAPRDLVIGASFLRTRAPPSLLLPPPSYCSFVLFTAPSLTGRGEASHRCLGLISVISGRIKSMSFSL